MALRNTTPLKLAPFSACDTLDSTDNTSGAMAALTNLIPDPTTKSLFQCRPASIQLATSANFVTAGFTAPGFISAAYMIGSQMYGMIACSNVAGKDKPFSYNVITGVFTAVGGTQNSTTLPTSPAATGTWVPPTMDLIGTKLVLTHPGFTGASSIYYAYIDVSNPAAPTYNAGNLDAAGAITFSTPPSFVKNFNQRAYYIVNPPTGQPSTIFSDSLNAAKATNANQAITYDDNVPLTAMGCVGVNSALTGGITQSLIVFKGVSNIYQITGDSATANLARNALNIPTGTLAPLGVAPTPKGLAFISPDGIRVIDTGTQVSDPIGFGGQGVCVPFTYAVTPSRMHLSCGGNVMRASVQNGYATGTPQQEWWYHFDRGIFTGPHTFNSSLCIPYNNTFIKTPIGVTASLWQSDVVQSSTSTYTENGVVMTFTAQTAQMPDTDQMCEISMVETTWYMALTSSGGAISVFISNQDGTVLDTVQVTSGGSATLWGQFQWGQAQWLGATSALYPRQLNWTIPIVFRRGALTAFGNCADRVKIGRIHLRYEKLGYLQMSA